MKLKKMTDKIFGIHAQTLTLRAKRAQVLAANMANAETPGYRARDINIANAFTSVLNNKISLVRTNKAHFPADADSPSGMRSQYRNPDQPSLDNNTVDIHRERAEFMQNMMMYQASLRFANGRVGGLLTAIRGE